MLEEQENKSTNSQDSSSKLETKSEERENKSTNSPERPKMNMIFELNSERPKMNTRLFYESGGSQFEDQD